MLTKNRSTSPDLGWTGSPKWYHASTSTNDAALRFEDKTEGDWLALHQSGAEKAISVSSYESMPGTESIEWSDYGRDKFNYCHHQKLWACNYPFLMYYRRYNVRTSTLPYATSYLETFRRLGTVSTAGYGLPANHTVLADNTLRARAYHNMIPRFRGKVDLMLSLFELKDFRDCAKFLVRNDRHFIPLQAKLRRMRKKPLFDPTRPLAGLWLLKRLMIDPFVADCMAILNQANVSAREAELQFQQNGLDENTSYYTEPIFVEDSRTIGKYNYYTRGTGIYERSVFTACMKYFYEYRIRSALNGWMKYWGLSGSYETFWNFIPFGFVLDYVLTVGKSIRAMEHDPNVHMSLLQYSESIKTTRIAGYSTSGETGIKALVHNNVYYSNPLVVLPIAGIVGSIYTRRPTEPYRGPALPKWKLPSGKQGITMAALARVLCS